MPIFSLREDYEFPPVELADKTGILAVGGDLSPGRLIEAYKHGIFPWFSEGDPIIWWSPDPRFVLFPDEIKIARTMRQVFNRHIFTVTFDKNFDDIIYACREPRGDKDGTWITDEMAEAYITLHRMGYAHSVEVWHEGSLAGGLYGVSLGRCFFGESMFTRVSNASKAALITLTQKLKTLDFSIIDCQVYTGHLQSLGARHIRRSEFIQIVNDGLRYESTMGDWGRLFENSGPIKGEET
jgi:leucyl/phenylalanyl-tRNA--protein transferase